MRRDQHLLGDVGERQQGLGEVSCCRLCRPNSKEILPRMHQHFVDARFLPTQDFCRRKYFVNAINLSTH
jgi:hypothetical protein